MTSLIIRMDDSGQVVIPETIRTRLGLRSGEPLVVTEVEGRIVLASVRGERIRARFAHAAQEFKKRLGAAVLDVDSVELVERAREPAVDSVQTQRP